MGNSGKILYYGLVPVAFYIVFAATVVPWQGMMSVLSGDYNDRNRLLTSRTVIGGLVGIVLLPGVEALGGGGAGAAWAWGWFACTSASGA